MIVNGKEMTQKKFVKMMESYSSDNFKIKILPHYDENTLRVEVSRGFLMEEYTFILENVGYFRERLKPICLM